MVKTFRPAPGWPVPPKGWTPHEGWEPEPDWPPAPEGWEFWEEKESPRRRWLTPVVGVAGLLVGVMIGVGGGGAQASAVQEREEAVAQESTRLDDEVLALGEREDELAALETTLEERADELETIAAETTDRASEVEAEAQAVADLRTSLEAEAAGLEAKEADIAARESQVSARESSVAAAAAAPAPVQPAAPAAQDVYYQNCDAARAAGAAPVLASDPGYRPALDRDGDGIGCE